MDSVRHKIPLPWRYRGHSKSLWLGSVLFFLAGCGQTHESPQEVFERFDATWKQSETHKLDELVSENTLRYFQGLQPWIVRGDEDSIKSLPLFDRYMVLKLRMNLSGLSREDWLDWQRTLESGAQSHALSGYLLEMLDDAFHQTSLGAVDTVAGVTAGQLYRVGSPTGLSVRFVFEEGWKIELSRFFRDRFDQQMKPYLSDRYKNRDRVWEMLAESYGDRADRNLFRSRIAMD